MGRFVKFTGALSGEPSITLPDGRKVRKGHAVEVDPADALDMLSWIDGKRDWEPGVRKVKEA